MAVIRTLLGFLAMQYNVMIGLIREPPFPDPYRLYHSSPATPREGKEVVGATIEDLATTRQYISESSVYNQFC